MPETRTTAIAIRTENPRAVALLQAANTVFGKAGSWATDTAQDFGALVSALMGPAVFSGYALAAWSLSSNFGWTSSFLFAKGPLSNWLVWLSIAILVNVASSILRRHTRPTV
jgi:ribosome biogenesis protein Tsr3